MHPLHLLIATIDCINTIFKLKNGDKCRKEHFPGASAIPPPGKIKLLAPGAGIEPAKTRLKSM